MMTPDSKIGAISTFLQRLDDLGLKRGRQFYFRGHSKLSFELKPSIYRNKGWIANEATMFKEVILRCPDDFAGGMSTFQALVRMQHYGLPTRLLDLTANPLVALYFACQPGIDNDEDADVIAFDFDVNQVKYFDSDTVNVIANLSRRPPDFRVPNIDGIDEFNADGAIKLLLHDIRQDRPNFEPKIRREHLLSVICVRPRLENPRIIRQDGAFLLFGCDIQKTMPATLPVEAVAARLVINRDKKKFLIDQLAKLGISKATLFPEIDQVASHVKDAYFAPVVSATSLSESQIMAFRVLSHDDAASVAEIAEEIGIAKSAVSRVIAELTEQGLIESVGSGRAKKWRVAPDAEVTDGLLRPHKDS